MLLIRRFYIIDVYFSEASSQKKRLHKKASIKKFATEKSTILSLNFNIDICGEQR